MLSWREGRTKMKPYIIAGEIYRLCLIIYLFCLSNSSRNIENRLPPIL